jgi:hypothetical protein
LDSVTRRRRSPRPAVKIAAWAGGELRIVRVLELGVPEVEWREDLGLLTAEPFGDGLALITHGESVCDEKGVLLAEIEVGVVNGQPGVRAIRAHGAALTSTLLRQRIPPLTNLVGDVSLTNTVRLTVSDEGELVGELPVAMPMTYIRSPEGQIQGVSGVGNVESAESLGPARDAIEADLAQFSATRRRRALTPSFLQKVTRVYRDAVKGGASTERAVMDRLGAPSKTTARRWIWHARKAGYLGPALGPWKAGERTEGSSSPRKRQEKGRG